ncbi:DUF1439 domain-containing protein [Komagataeibacter sp. FNDCR1]|nr:DUF1439 domain-containing protein [Komagataeibacter sp. FNDCR1]
MKPTLRKWRLYSALFALLLTLGGLFAAYDVKKQVTIPLSTIQASIDRHLPYRKAMLVVNSLKIGDAGPQGMTADIQAGISLMGLHRPAQASGRFRLAYDPGTKTFHLSGFDIRQVSLGYAHKAPEGGEGEVAFSRLDAALNAIFRTIPVYRIHEDSLKGFFLGEALTDVQVRDGAVIATLQPMHAIVAGLIILVAALMLVILSMGVAVMVFSAGDCLGTHLFFVAFVS